MRELREPGAPSVEVLWMMLAIILMILGISFSIVGIHDFKAQTQMMLPAIPPVWKIFVGALLCIICFVIIKKKSK